ncbi:NADP(H)-dependent aldo-keto reductase [Antarcticibacterium sp. 1MA-6-2]|uniref:NADP(H)-dependent aldo-keto reductase n=1 Tax=Antarcticibacterium sp. 1MA-6-2 TaxID=2908210 RepID=UPI001F454804|nr:NADP(H)-dependent aldo-keto reductase [Antarcticibacterium sp. 1MA-6-2]UJH89967.1 NADP(H)-dependent aldo-keto reductase [Antarcticibacterium sp. 1MA-6-2]
MEYTRLPDSDIEVSKICLGSMTWGEQNTEAEGHLQMDYAIEQGVNFIDTAEMYPIPANEKTQGSTEEIIGSWFRKNGNRDKVVLASKIVGPGNSMSHIRPNLDFSKESLKDALNKSLKRLHTDYVDLYQLHWPERNTNFFGKLDYEVDPEDKWSDNFREILLHLEGFIKEGKIRKIGLSNETPYGVMRCVEEARKGAPKISTVQNPYSLLNRKDEVGLSEIYHRENIGLFPYSPLGMGTLSGKYLNEQPQNTRLTLFPQYTRYSSEQAVEATKRYCEIADKFSLKPAQMALAFVRQQPFVTSTIIGATTMDQLKENISSINVELSSEVITEINKVHKAFPNPAP